MTPENSDFKELFYALPSPYMMLDTELRFFDMNDAYLRVTRQSRDNLIGRLVFDAFPESPEREAVFASAFERALRGEANRLVRQPFSIPRPDSEGGGFREVWWNCHHLPIHDVDGNLCGVVQKAEDVTSEVKAERLRDVITREFDHRIKNLLSVVVAIARQTANNAESPETFTAEFEERIQAMVRTHQMLVDTGWATVALGDLLEAHLEPYQNSDNACVSLSGPPVTLSSRQTQSLGMAFHELATNAAKYGAFSDAQGRLEVNWSIDGDGKTCRIEWHEDGLTDVGAPSRTGFGSTIMERVLPAELDGSVTRDFTPTGLRCTIAFPLAKV